MALSYIKSPYRDDYIIRHVSTFKMFNLLASLAFEERLVYDNIDIKNLELEEMQQYAYSNFFQIDGNCKKNFDLIANLINTECRGEKYEDGTPDLNTELLLKEFRNPIKEFNKVIKDHAKSNRVNEGLFIALDKRIIPIPKSVIINTFFESFENERDLNNLKERHSLFSNQFNLINENEMSTLASTVGGYKELNVYESLTDDEMQIYKPDDDYIISDEQVDLQDIAVNNTDNNNKHHEKTNVLFLLPDRASYNLTYKNVQSRGINRNNSIDNFKVEQYHQNETFEKMIVENLFFKSFKEIETASWIIETSDYATKKYIYSLVFYFLKNDNIATKFFPENFKTLEELWTLMLNNGDRCYFNKDIKFEVMRKLNSIREEINKSVVLLDKANFCKKYKIIDAVFILKNPNLPDDSYENFIQQYNFTEIDKKLVQIINQKWESLERLNIDRATLSSEKIVEWAENELLYG